MSGDPNLIHCLDFEELPDVTPNASQLWEGILQPLEGDALVPVGFQGLGFRALGGHLAAS
jgi:hypothetical protein